MDPAAVRRARLDRGLSLAEVAGRDVSRTAIHLIEKGRMRPSRRTLELVAERTGRPVSYFISDEDAPAELRAARDEVERLVAAEQFRAAVREGEAVLEQELPERIEADVRLAVGRAYVRLADGHSAHPYAVRARELYEQAANELMTVAALDQEMSALFLMADVRMLPVGLRALELGMRLSPQPVRLLVHILFVVGGQYVNQHQWEMAAKQFEFGLQLAGDVANRRDVAKLHSGLGAAYQALGRIELSLEHARHARRLLRASGDPYDAATGEHNLGETLLRNGDLAAAARHFMQALQVCEQHDLRRSSRCITLCSLAEVHLAQGKLDRGRALLDEALSLSRELSERMNEANAWRLLGRLRGLENDMDAAGPLFARAIDLYKALDMPRRVHDCHVEYARILGEAGRLEESLAQWEAAVDAVGGVKTPAQPSADVAIELRNA